MSSPLNNTTIHRRQTRQVMVKHIPIGGDAPIAIQSMTTTDTTDVDATVRQIRALATAGCEIVRVAVPTQAAADALPVIAERHLGNVGRRVEDADRIELEVGVGLFEVEPAGDVVLVIATGRQVVYRRRRNRAAD